MNNNSALIVSEALLDTRWYQWYNTGTKFRAWSLKCLRCEGVSPTIVNANFSATGKTLSLIEHQEDCPIRIATWHISLYGGSNKEATKRKCKG